MRGDKRCKRGEMIKDFTIDFKLDVSAFLVMNNPLIKMKQILNSFSLQTRSHLMLILFAFLSAIIKFQLHDALSSFSKTYLFMTALPNEDDVRGRFKPHTKFSNEN